jgi:hypothetical protein
LGDLTLRRQYVLVITDVNRRYLELGTTDGIMRTRRLFSCPLSLIHQMPTDKFMQQTGRKRLIGNTLLKSARLQIS